MEFKEGQKVKVKPHVDVCRGVKEGIIYEVKLDNGEGLYVGNKIYVTDWCACNEHWQLVSEDPYENLKVGDWLVDENKAYRRILADLGGKGELHTYILSLRGKVKEDVDTKSASDNNWTVHDMKVSGLVPENSTPLQIKITAEQAIQAYKEQNNINSEVVIKE